MSAQDVKKHTSSSVHVHYAGPFDDQGNVVCYKHQLVAVLRESKTDKNPEREFYSCSKERSDPDRCNFFLWADEISLPKIADGDTADESAEAQLPQSTPSTWSESPSSTYAPSLLLNSPLNLPSTPDDSIYGAFLEFSDDLERNSPRQYRLASLDSQFSGPGQGSNASSSSRLLPSSSPPLSFPVDHVSRGDRRTSNISVPSSASSRNVLAPDRPQTLGRISPASSTKAEFVSATSSGRVREDIYHSFNSGSGSVDRYNSKSVRPKVANSPTIRSSKHMDRAIVSSTPLRPHSNAGPHPAYIRPQQHTVQVLNITPSADTVAAHLEALASIPSYLRKLERKQAASEKSIRVKSKRIAELEEEVRRLAAENAQLKALASNDNQPT